MTAANAQKTSLAQLGHALARLGEIQRTVPIGIQLVQTSPHLTGEVELEGGLAHVILSR